MDLYPCFQAIYRQAQTGPAVRWDENVIEKQMALLGDMPDLQQMYETMTQSIHRLQTEDL